MENLPKLLIATFYTWSTHISACLYKYSMLSFLFYFLCFSSYAEICVLFSFMRSSIDITKDAIVGVSFFPAHINTMQ